MRGTAGRRLVLAAACLLSRALYAQGPTTGAIDGSVEDQAHVPLLGVTLEARSPSLQGSRVSATDSGGRFRLSSLPPGIYRLSAMLPGFVSIDTPGIRVSLGETATMPLTMKIAVSTEIEVGTTAPLLDVTSATGGQNIRYDVIRNLPVGRNYADILRINPGVATDNAETQGRAIPFTIYGATSLENQYLVDGANTTNVIKGFEGKALPNEFVEEVQIKTSGYEAEYGHALGGIVNVVTKSGGNELHGDVFGYFGAKALTASSRARAETDEFFVDRTSENRRDYGIDVGGPFLKDRLWFFGAYNRIDLDQDQRVVADPDVPTAGQTFPITYSQNVFAGKLTLRVSDATTLIGTVFGDPERRQGSVRNFRAPAAATRDGTRELGGTDATISATHLFGATGLANVRYAHHRDTYRLTGDSRVQLWDYTADPNNPLVIGGIGLVAGSYENNSSTRDAWKGDGTLFAGNHEIKGGVEWERNETNADAYFSGGQIVFENLCPASGPSLCPAGQTAYYQHNFFTANRSDPVGGFDPAGVRKTPKTNRLSLFVQDAFKAAPNVTINAGLRFDQDDVKNQAGQTVMKLSKEWQPRIGLAWDVQKDGRSRLSASYGRFYYALPTALTVAVYGGEISAHTFNFSPTALEQDPAAPRLPSVFGGGPPVPVQERIQGIYQDEVTLGLERAFDTSFSVGVRYTFRNLGRVIESRCDLDPGYPEARDIQCIFLNPGSNSPYSTGQGIHGCDGRDELGTDGNPPESQCTSPSIYPLASMPSATRRYHGIEIVAKKQMKDRLFLQASYIYSSLRGNYDGAASNAFGTADFGLAGTRVSSSLPGFNEDFDYAGLWPNNYGKLFLDRPHSFRLDTAYAAPFGLGIGLQTFFRSGAPISKQEVFGYYGYLRYVTPRGSEGRQAWDYEVSLQLQYALRLRSVTLTVFVQGFNLLDRQAVLDTDQALTQAPAVEVDYVNPNYGKSVSRRDPRSFRVGARVSF